MSKKKKEKEKGMDNQSDYIRFDKSKYSHRSLRVLHDPEPLLPGFYLVFFFLHSSPQKVPEVNSITIQETYLYGKERFVIELYGKSLGYVRLG